jgi:sugar lactone lactonase YvrE
MNVEVLVAAGALVGEGPCWDPASQRLLWVDLGANRVHSSDLSTGGTDTRTFAETVGAVVPIDGGGMLLANTQGFARIQRLDAKLELVVEVESDLPNNRMNDGKCDPFGRMWAGSMSLTLARNAGSLYRLDSDMTTHRVLGRTTVSNGLAFTPDARKCYFIDSVLRRVDVLALDEAGSLLSRDVFIDLSPYPGSADGMTIDSEGCLWIAFYRAGQVRRFSCAGRMEKCIEFPATITTSVAFGGPHLDILCVTTGNAALSENERIEQSYAGSIFGVDVGVTGRPEVAFRCRA